MRLGWNLKRCIIAGLVYNEKCYHQDLVKSIHKPIVITIRHDFTAIPALTMEDTISLKIPCNHADDTTSFEVRPPEENTSEVGISSSLLAERISIFYYQKTLELVPNVNRVVIVMAIKEIAAIQMKISDVQVHYYCITIVTYHHCQNHSPFIIIHMNFNTNCLIIRFMIEKVADV